MLASQPLSSRHTFPQLLKGVSVRSPTSELYNQVLTSAVSVVPLAAWGAGESAVTIVAASIPVLRALLKQSHQNQIPMGYTPGIDINTTMATFGSSKARTTLVMSRLKSQGDRSSTGDLMGIPASQFQSSRNSMEDGILDGKKDHGFDFGLGNHEETNHI